MTEHGGAAALKQNNLAALRSALYHTDFATKKELAEQCRLSLAACTALLGEMIDDGQVLELAFAASNGGRPARRFSINPNYAHILCLYTANNDVERSGIALRVCDLKGNSLQEKFCPLNDILPEDLTLFITQMVQADPLIRAVGIGISGVTDREGAIESLAFPALNGFNPKKVLEEQLGITVITENDMHFTSYGFSCATPATTRTPFPFSTGRATAAPVRAPWWTDTSSSAVQNMRASSSVCRSSTLPLQKSRPSRA